MLPDTAACGCLSADTNRVRSKPRWQAWFWGDELQSVTGHKPYFNIFVQDLSHSENPGLMVVATHRGTTDGVDDGGPSALVQYCASTAKFLKRQLTRLREPGILPCGGKIVIISPVQNISATTVTDLDSLMISNRHRGSNTNAGSLLSCEWISYTVVRRLATIPKVAIDRQPEPPPLDVITQVTLNSANRLLRL